MRKVGKFLLLCIFSCNSLMFTCYWGLCCGQEALGKDLGFNASKWNHGGWSWSSIWFIRNVEPSNPTVLWTGLVVVCLPICSQSKINHGISVPSNTQWSLGFKENQREVICATECHPFPTSLLTCQDGSTEGSQQARQQLDFGIFYSPWPSLHPDAALFFWAKHMLPCFDFTTTTSKHWAYPLLLTHNRMDQTILEMWMSEALILDPLHSPLF